MGNIFTFKKIRYCYICMEELTKKSGVREPRGVIRSDDGYSVRLTNKHLCLWCYN